MEEQKTNYINIADQSSPVHPGGSNIFTELSEELDFGEEGNPEPKGPTKKEGIVIAYQTSSVLLILAVIVLVVTTLDTFLRSEENNSFLANLPVCSYLSWGVENYNNTDCKTLAMISDGAAKEREKLEGDIIANLIVLVPKWLQSIDILTSPKVRFIQEHSGDSRVSINTVIDRFLDIKKQTVYQGQDIDCKNIVINEKGKMSVTCDVYGGAMTSIGQTDTRTSRKTTLTFLDNLLDPKSGFQVVSYPKSLEIAPFSSSE